MFSVKRISFVLGAVQLGGYALYKLLPGHQQNQLKHWFGVEKGSTPVGVLTSPFIQNDITQLGFNLYTLYFFGSSTVRFLGLRNFLILYLGGAYASSLVQYVQGKENFGFLGGSAALLMT